MENTFFAVILGFLIGSLFYYYDRKSGKKLYKKWYDISNKNELDDKINVGFVDGRLFGQKLTVAATITVICYLLSIIIGGISPFKGLFYAGGLFVGILASFYIAGMLFNVFSKKANKTIEFIESIEKGEKNIKDVIPSAKEIKEKIIPSGNESSVKKPENDTIKEEESSKEKEDKKEKKDDWRDGVQKFLDK